MKKISYNNFIKTPSAQINLVCADVMPNGVGSIMNT